MIVADASAILAILLEEPDREGFVAKLSGAPQVVMSPINYCFAYALAKQRNAPLLFKGDDFAKTDIEAA